MKKNKMMRIASVLLVATLLSTCVISGTFAKYVTSGVAADTARVAKWGIVITPTSDLFATSYDLDDTTFSTYMNLSVKSSDTDKVVAPGTTGSGLTLGVTDDDVEVSYRVSVKLEDTSKDVFLLDDGTGNPITYYPVKWTLTDGTNTIIEACSLADMQTALDGKDLYWYNVENGVYYWEDKDGNSYDSSTAPTIDLSWNWAFYVSDTNDIYDTILGNLAVDPAWYSANINTDEFNTVIELDYTITVTQID